MKTKNEDKKRALGSKIASFLMTFGAIGAALHLLVILLAVLFLRSYDLKIDKMLKLGIVPMSTSGRNIIVGHVIGALLWTGFFLLLLSTGIPLKYMAKKKHESGEAKY